MNQPGCVSGPGFPGSELPPVLATVLGGWRLSLSEAPVAIIGGSSVLWLCHPCGVIPIYLTPPPRLLGRDQKHVPTARKSDDLKCKVGVGAGKPSGRYCLRKLGGKNGGCSWFSRPEGQRCDAFFAVFVGLRNELINGIPTILSLCLALDLCLEREPRCRMAQFKTDGIFAVGAQAYRHDTVRMAGQNFTIESHAVDRERHLGEGLFDVEFTALRSI